MFVSWIIYELKYIIELNVFVVFFSLKHLTMHNALILWLVYVIINVFFYVVHQLWVRVIITLCFLSTFSQQNSFPHNTNDVGLIINIFSYFILSIPEYDFHIFLLQFSFNNKAIIYSMLKTIFLCKNKQKY